MLTNKRLVRVQWGDCDPAGIVFYPRYFEMFDASTILLFEKATGLTKIKMLEKYEGAGLALLEARAEFKVASAYGDDIEIETEITDFRRSSFFVRHTVTKAGGVLGLSRDALVDHPRPERPETPAFRDNACRDHRGLQAGLMGRFPPPPCAELHIARGWPAN
jgi:4-hydroxybenzoyl-CoA thioesterase